jgi:putative FmdB family regulatory protein
MPLYEYRCDACAHRFEVIQKFADLPPAQCAKCGKGPVTRMHSSPAIQFKGTGFYITDYAKKGSSGTDSSSAEKADKTEKTDKKSDGSSSGSTAKTDAAPAAPAAPKPSSET